MTVKIINESFIQQCLLENDRENSALIRDILEKATLMQGLNVKEVAALTAIHSPELLQALFDTAKKIKETIYGKRLVVFAPLYVSNLCSNNCVYCAFRSDNQGLVRRALSLEEIAEETKCLIDEGHKRVLLVAGEAYPKGGLSYINKAVETIYATKSGRGEIRRVNVNIAPLTVEEFKILKTAEIGTYQLFQETYHRETYANVHLSGKKSDYDFRVECMDRAMQAGIDDVGIGVLFGLADWRFEILALLQHAEYLEKTYGVGPHTISVPRLEPAGDSEVASHPPKAVSDEDFYKIIAILRLAVPYTGIILSTRETPETRREALALGVSQISAGSRTNPGGYAEGNMDAEQFSLGDHRSLDDVIRDVASMGYVPSFCTGCYRLGRTGEHFMELAKPGAIKKMCEPNGVVTFKEYLDDYASDETKKIGEALIESELEKMPKEQKSLTQSMMKKIKSGERDVFV